MICYKCHMQQTAYPASLWLDVVLYVLHHDHYMEDLSTSNKWNFIQQDDLFFCYAIKRHCYYYLWFSYFFLFSSLQWSALPYFTVTVLYGTALYCYCTALYCYCTVRYCTALYSYCTVLCCTVLHCTVLHCSVWYCTVLRVGHIYYTTPWIIQACFISSVYSSIVIMSISPSVRLSVRLPVTTVSR